MNSIENALITAINTELQREYPGIMVYSDATAFSSTFPCVSIYEADNAFAAGTYDTSRVEKYSDVMYQIDAYSNLTEGRKAQCKDIIRIVDNVMTGYGIERTSMSPTPNVNDSNIYRITARYSARIDKNNTIYRR